MRMAVIRYWIANLISTIYPKGQTTGMLRWTCFSRPHRVECGGGLKKKSCRSGQERKTGLHKQRPLEVQWTCFLPLESEAF